MFDGRVKQLARLERRWTQGRCGSLPESNTMQTWRLGFSVVADTPASVSTFYGDIMNVIQSLLMHWWPATFQSRLWQVFLAFEDVDLKLQLWSASSFLHSKSGLKQAVNKYTGWNDDPEVGRLMALKRDRYPIGLYVLNCRLCENFVGIGIWNIRGACNTVTWKG